MKIPRQWWPPSCRWDRLSFGWSVIRTVGQLVGQLGSLLGSQLVGRLAGQGHSFSWLVGGDLRAHLVCIGSSYLEKLIDCLQLPSIMFKFLILALLAASVSVTEASTTEAPTAPKFLQYIYRRLAGVSPPLGRPPVTGKLSRLFVCACVRAVEC